jgi:hypothetical protein
MAKVTYAAGIDHVSGSLSKPKQKNGHSCGTYLIGTHREAPTTNPSCSRLYIRPNAVYHTNRTPGADELAARNRFATVAAAVRVRAKDLTKIVADQQAFLAQKDQAGGCKTIKKWYWMVEGEAYDAQH